MTLSLDSLWILEWRFIELLESSVRISEIEEKVDLY